MIDYGNGMIFPDSWAYGPPDPPEEPEPCTCGREPWIVSYICEVCGGVA